MVLIELTNGVRQTWRVYHPRGISPTVPTSCGGHHIPFVLVSPKLTNMPFKSTKNISPTIRSTAMLQISNGQMSQILNFFAEDSPANLSQSQANEEVSWIREVHSFLKLLGLHRKNNHAFYFLKTLKGFYLTTKAKLSELSSIRWMNLGITSNGKCLTVKTLASPKTESECSLLDILEPHPNPKYFLSNKATATLFREIKKQRNSLPIPSQENMELAMSEEPTSQQRM